MNKFIYCKNEGQKNLNFYVKVNSKEYLLFSHYYSTGLKEYYQNGVHVNDIGKAEKCHNYIVRRIATKLKSYLRYVENEYGVVVLEKTDKRAHKIDKSYKRAKFNCDKNLRLAYAG